MNENHGHPAPGHPAHGDLCGRWQHLLGSRSGGGQRHRGCWMRGRNARHRGDRGPSFRYEHHRDCHRNGNFAGGFSLDGAQIKTDQGLSDTNKQGTIVTPPGSDVVVTAEDGPTVAFPCKSVCAKAFGVWSAINVNNGQVFGTYFPVTLTLRASDLPNNLSQLGMVHVLDNGKAVVLKQCTTSTLQDCVQATPVGSAYF